MGRRLRRQRERPGGVGEQTGLRRRRPVGNVHVNKKNTKKTTAAAAATSSSSCSWTQRHRRRLRAALGRTAPPSCGWRRSSSCAASWRRGRGSSRRAEIPTSAASGLQRSEVRGRAELLFTESPWTQRLNNIIIIILLFFVMNWVI